MYIRAYDQEFNVLILHHPKERFMNISDLFPAKIYRQRISEPNLKIYE